MLFKRSIDMRGEDVLDLNSLQQATKRQKLSDDSYLQISTKLEEQLATQQELIQSFKDDLNSKLDQKLQEIQKIQQSIQDSLKD